MKRFRNFLRRYRRKIEENPILSSNPIDELFDQRRKCTCHLFELKMTEMKRENFLLDEFCFWFDIRTTLKDLVDRVVHEENRKRKRKQISISIQTSPIDDQRKSVKIQTNSLVLFPHRFLSKIDSPDDKR